MDTGFGVGIALDTDSLARSLPGTGIGGGTLAAHRQSAEMADSTIALDALESLEVQAELASKIAFDHILSVLDRVNDLGKLLFVQVLGAKAGIDFSLFQNDVGVGRTNAINVAQGDIDALLTRNLNSNNTCHIKSLTLPLFMAGIRANDTNDAFASDYFAMFAKSFY